MPKHFPIARSYRQIRDINCRPVARGSAMNAAFTGERSVRLQDELPHDAGIDEVIDGSDADQLPVLGG